MRHDVLMSPRAFVNRGKLTDWVRPVRGHGTAIEDVLLLLERSLADECVCPRLLADVYDGARLGRGTPLDALNRLVYGTAVPEDQTAGLGLDAAR